jgi:hypothetical protein
MAWRGNAATTKSTAKTPRRQENTQDSWRLGVLETWRSKVFSKKEFASK